MFFFLFHTFNIVIKNIHNFQNQANKKLKGVKLHRSSMKFLSGGMFKGRILSEVSLWPSISIHQTVICGLLHPFFALSHVKSFAFPTMHPLCGAIFFYLYSYPHVLPWRLWKNLSLEHGMPFPAETRDSRQLLARAFTGKMMLLLW